MFRNPSTQGFAPFGNSGPRPQHGPQHTAWPYGRNVWGPNDWVHGRGSTRNPPSWAPEIESQYPFRHWVTDVVTWCMSTDVDETRKGPQIELSLGGVARDLVREIPLDAKINGAVVDLGDGSGPQRLTGAAFILHGLAQHYMPLEEESNLRSLADLHGFVRLPGESVDTVLTRFEVIVQRARTRARIPLQNTHAAWMLMLALRIPTEYWVHLLTPFRGALPTTDMEYRQFIEYVRRFGHLAEAGNYSIAQGVTTGHPTMFAEGVPGQMAPDGGTQGTVSGSIGGMFPDSGTQGTASGSMGGMFPTDGSTAQYFEDDSDTSDDEEGHYQTQDADEPDMTGWTANQVGEFYYQKYKHYKRKWRRFSGRQPKRSRGPTRRRHFLADEVTEAYFGKGGGKGKGRRKGNPIGRDGQPLRCSICNSDQHLRARCPQAGKGGGKGTPPATLHTQQTPSNPFTEGPLANFVSAPAESVPASSTQGTAAAPSTAVNTQPGNTTASTTRASGSNDPWHEGQDPWQNYHMARADAQRPHVSAARGWHRGTQGSAQPPLRGPAVHGMFSSGMVQGGPPSGMQDSASWRPSLYPDPSGHSGMQDPMMSAGTGNIPHMPHALTHMMAMPPPRPRRQREISDSDNAGLARVLHQYSGSAQQQTVAAQLPDAPMQTSGGIATTVHTSTVLAQFITNQIVATSTRVQPALSTPQYDISGGDDPMDLTDEQYETPHSSEEEEEEASWAVVGSNAVERPVLAPPSEHESRRDDNETLCIICLAQDVTHRLQPCLHSHFCETCAALVIAGAVRTPPECPLCRVEVTSSEAIPHEVAVQQQPQRQQASRDVTTYAFLL